MHPQKDKKDGTLKPRIKCQHKAFLGDLYGLVELANKGQYEPVEVKSQMRLSTTYVQLQFDNS